MTMRSAFCFSRSALRTCCSQFRRWAASSRGMASRLFLVSSIFCSACFTASNFFSMSSAARWTILSSCSTRRDFSFTCACMRATLPTPRAAPAFKRVAICWARIHSALASFMAVSRRVRSSLIPARAPANSAGVAFSPRAAAASGRSGSRESQRARNNSIRGCALSFRIPESASLPMRKSR